MTYRRLGRTGLRVSSVSIGGWLTLGASVDEDMAIAVLHRALDLGINFIDLADVYARGEAERVAGRALRDHRRQDLVISSKVFWPMSDDVNDRGLSRKHIHESIDATLRRLGTDYVDLYFCHRHDPDTPLEETVRAMDDLVRAGKVLYWGTSVWTADQLRAAHAMADRFLAYRPVVEQPRHNLLDRSVERDVLPAARELGMGVVTWSPLAQGLLTGKYNEGVPPGSRGATSSWLDAHLVPETLERVRAFCALADDLGLRPAELALAWALHVPGITSVITGASRPEQVEENAAAAGVELAPETLDRLDALFPLPKE
ncbi:MAG: aldo/keto reductase [Deltaproteobacteria bacterium]|nr:MAG: aldo/keto reductase [Deltaproteobacteria bacterium]